MIHGVISSIICAEFESNSKFTLKRYLTSRDTAMRLEFALHSCKGEEGYRHLEIAIFGAGSNYIKVYARIKWSVIPEKAIDGDNSLKEGYAYTEGETPWVLLSDHDSCWKSDGVASIIASFRERISHLNTVGCAGSWYKAWKLSALEQAMFLDLAKNRTYAKLQDLEFRFPTV
jgi:hypothetical protein